MITLNKMQFHACRRAELPCEPDAVLHRDHFIVPPVNDAYRSRVRRGVLLVRMTLRMGAAVPDAAVTAMNQDANNCAFGTYTVREIPDSLYQGFVDRGIYWAGSTGSSVDRAWMADEGTIEFGHLDQDPWTDMPVLGVTQASIFELTVPKEVFSDLQLIEKL